MTMQELTWLDVPSQYAELNPGVDAKQLLRSSLDQALDNGYDNTLTNSPIEIASDLGDYDARFEGIDPNSIADLVENWQNEKKGRQDV